MDCLAAEAVRLGLLIRFRGITCRLLKSPASQINALDVGLWHYSGVFLSIYRRPVESLLQKGEIRTKNFRKVFISFNYKTAFLNFVLV